MQLNVQVRHSQYVKLTNFQAIRDARGTRILRYTVDATNTRFNQHRTLSAADYHSLQLKLQALVNGWDAKIDAQLEIERVQGEKVNVESLASDAEGKRQRFTSILKKTVDRDDRIVWDQLKSKEKYKTEPFSKLRPRQPSRFASPVEPQPEKVGFLAGLFGGRQAAEIRHRERMADHATKLLRAEERFMAEQARFSAEMEVYRAEEEAWKIGDAAKAQAHAEVVKDQHRSVDILRERWISGEEGGILEHASLVLDSSDYGDLFQPDYDLDWIESSKTLLVAYRLPALDAVPRLKTARLVVSTGEIKETFVTEKQQAEIYDSACYQICLRTIHEIYEADEPAHIRAIVFNGFVQFVDRATGKEVTATILSLSAERNTFLDIDLARVDAKACFKSFKGVAAASLASMAAIPPVLQLNKLDRRFVESREVNLDEDGGTNLASMPWEEFEQLIRQVFGQVFSARGGEVKVTQASRDGGVDAVAFDPDPIGGGKIVIQAKRYTRTVGVSAVRDL